MFYEELDPIVDTTENINIIIVGDINGRLGKINQ